MCIPLTSLEVSNNLLTVNLDDHELYPTVTVTYSIQTKAIDNSQANMTRKEIIASVNTLDNSYNTIKAFFLPIFGFTINEIEILDLDKHDKVVIDDVFLHIQDLKEQSKPKPKKIAKTVSNNSNSSISNLSNSSQVILASSPNDILSAIDQVLPQYTQKLLDYADQIIDQTNGTALEHCTCLIFLADTKSHSREYIAYKTNYQGGYYWLPTAESNHKTAVIPSIIKFKSTVLWGGNNKDHPATYRLGLSNNKQLVPQYVYGIADLEKTLNNEFYSNGFVGIDFEDTDPENLEYNKDSYGISLKSIRTK